MDELTRYIFIDYLHYLRATYLYPRTIDIGNQYDKEAEIERFFVSPSLESVLRVPQHITFPLRNKK